MTYDFLTYGFITPDFIIKIFFVGLISLALAYAVFTRSSGESGSESAPIIHGALLPSFLAVLIALFLIVQGREATFKVTLSMCFSIFLHMSIYYIILILILPYIRKHISARSCALLWIVPNYLYFTQNSFMNTSRPLIVFHASSTLVKAAVIVWIAGFAACFMYSILHHLAFRKSMLKDAIVVTDSHVLQVYNDELKKAGIRKPKFKLMQSDKISTPITIGLYPRTTRLVLPKDDFSQAELALIFKHEFVHITRKDSWTKFFMVFCAAMCWFNPLMWLAMKKSAEDMELSCDETVLLGADDETKRRYADLILTTAGSDAGFSTCLSASACAMRYRLKSIVNPPKRHSGALAVALTFFLLCMTSGYVALAYGEDTAATTIYNGHNLSEYSVSRISLVDRNYDADAVDSVTYDVSAMALTEYISQMKTQEITGNYSLSNDYKYVSIIYHGPHELLVVELYSDFITVTDFSDSSSDTYTYHLPEPTDWDYVNSILQTIPVAN